LLPHEIDQNITNLDYIRTTNKVNFVGMFFEPWNPVIEFCKNNGLEFTHRGGFEGNNISTEENQKLIQESVIAPSIQSKWQVDNGYIPCRIFKNISYGKMGITNSRVVFELFQGKIVYDPDTYEACRKGLQYEEKPDTKLMVELMNVVKEKHTYLNRIQTIFDCFKELELLSIA